MILICPLIGAILSWCFSINLHLHTTALLVFGARRDNIRRFFLPASIDFVENFFVWILERAPSLLVTVLWIFVD